MIRIKKGAFLYQKQKTSDQNATKLSFVFLTHIAFASLRGCPKSFIYVGVCSTYSAIADFPT